ncbi:interleukin-7 isoform X3 [Manis javanica]|uniref:interleukin-7 isoform X3 n=1 Tax=Manis javanica TaxID=9974 RepID=UPI003C6D5B18
MFHVSSRYVFGIPPLILVLLPVASFDCDIKGKDGREYRNVLKISIEDLDSMIKTHSNCLNNESSFFKRHACDDNKEATFLYHAARKLKQFKMNASEDFDIHLSRVSQGTLKLLNCSNKEGNKSSKEQKRQNYMCFLKILLQKIKSCWNKILRDAKEH